jgi:hypothetical protein
LRHAHRDLWVALTILIWPVSLKAAPIIISVTAPPALSTLIDSSSVVSTSWSQSKAYTGVSITALVDSAILGQTPMADAYLTTAIGPGTTTMDEIARAQFTVPATLPICSMSSCGAMVTLFSGLSLGPGNYFVTMGPDPLSNGLVGWFPALNPTVLLDTGVSEGTSFIASAMASYPPASAFTVYTMGLPPIIFNVAMNFAVTGTTAIPEPSTSALIAFAVLLLILSKGIANSYRSSRPGQASDCEFEGRHAGGRQPSKQCRLEPLATCSQAALNRHPA